MRKFNLFAAFVLWIAFLPSLAATYNMQMDFGLLPVSADKTQSFRLGNNGVQSIPHLTWKISGDSYTASSNCPTSLPPGAACDFVVTFWCLREGYAEGLLKIETNKDIYAIKLTGVGNKVSYPEPRPPMPRP